jgi:asparagine synthase (glutamine-hydrolysing)
MCGIAGGFAFGFSAQVIEETIVERLNYQQRRRGPDGTGLWYSQDRRIVMGHRRLAIIETGPEGAQPMCDATGRWVISFNGEVYNYRALRRELEGLGCVFRTYSDTEVLINVVARWGEAGLRKLRGMYAVALWDCVERELWLFRDPYGIKPLYYAESAGMLWFASQARALARCAPINTNRDAAALAGFYLWGHVPEPFTWWVGIRMLPAGHVLRVRAGAECRTNAFAKIEHTYVNRPARPPLFTEELNGLLRESVSYHLVSDVPIGIFLSAGIDSNIVGALAGELRPNMQAVTLAFHEFAGTENDEAPLAAAAARTFGCQHSICRVGRSEFETLVDDFFDCMDQPTIDGLNTYLVSYAAAKLGLKVALSGLGGDELFGGYPSFRDIPRLVRWAPPRNLQPLARAIQRALRAAALPGMPPKLPGVFTHSASLATCYLLRRSLYLEDELDALLDESWISEGLERLSSHSALEATVLPLRAAEATQHAEIAALESCWYMRNQLLRDTDWASMAHGVEVRLPLVDFALIENLGPAIASHSPPMKRDLAACCDRLPQAIRERSKTGFTTPVRQWIAGGRDEARGLRGWAGMVHQRFRSDQTSQNPNIPLRGAA